MIRSQATVITISKRLTVEAERLPRTPSREANSKTIKPSDLMPHFDEVDELLPSCQLPESNHSLAKDSINSAVIRKPQLDRMSSNP